MPEILEVELYRGLAEHALGRTIERVWMVDSRYGRGGTTARRLQSALAGRRFTEARRRGKLLLLDTDSDGDGDGESNDGPTLGVRFGMTGGLVVDGDQALDRLLYGPGIFSTKWVRARVTFADGGHLLVHDPRRFGSLELAPDESRLGPDALSATLAELGRALEVTSTRPSAAAPLKARLLDQERVAGIGNLLADEMLWRAALDPERRTPLSDTELRALHTAMRATLRRLGRLGGSHMGDLMEQRRDGGRCPLDGAELRRSTVGGRTTWWCPAHQH